MDDKTELRLQHRWQGASKAQSAADLVYGVLRVAIVERDIPPGWRLNEARLASVFRVSRTPIREALARLMMSDMIERDDHGGIRVKIPTPDRVLEVYAVRVPLEGLAARLAAQAATPTLVTRLHYLNSRLEDAINAGDTEGMVKSNLDFHTAIAQATHNQMLIRFIEQIHSWVRCIPTTTLTHPTRGAQAVTQHEQLIAAIAKHDGDRAEQLAREHMHDAEQIRIKMVAAIV